MTEAEVNERIKVLCEAKGYVFRPWEARPWDVDIGPSPWPAGTAGAASWPNAQALRMSLIAEIKGQQVRDAG